MEVRHAALTDAEKVASSPVWIGSRNVIRSRPAVTTRPPECRIAAMPATSSQNLRTVPPWTNPAVFVSVTPIHRTRTERDAATGRGSMTLIEETGNTTAAFRDTTGGGLPGRVGRPTAGRSSRARVMAATPTRRKSVVRTEWRAEVHLSMGGEDAREFLR